MSPDAGRGCPAQAPPTDTSATDTDDRNDTPRRQERVVLLDSVTYLIAMDVARELDRVPEGWPVGDYTDALAVFWREVVDTAVRAGIERHRQASK